MCPPCWRLLYSSSKIEIKTKRHTKSYERSLIDVLYMNINYKTLFKRLTSLQNNLLTFLHAAFSEIYANKALVFDYNTDLLSLNVL